MDDPDEIVAHIFAHYEQCGNDLCMPSSHGGEWIPEL